MDYVNDDDLKWEELRTEHLVQDEWIDFRRSAYRFPDGTVYEPYYSYSRRDYVVIVASDTEGDYVCVKQYRQGIREVTTEFPAGAIERKDSAANAANAVGEDHAKSILSEEAALEAAKRELREETGYVSDEWKHLITIPANATLADNYVYVYTARNCRKAASQELDETEFLNVRKFSAAEIEKMISGGAFQQAVHVMAWLLSQKK